MKKNTKNLFVLRHAKSSWSQPDLADFDRPLNERGLKAAPFMGEVMRENDFLPQMILSSPAERAKRTAILIKQAADLDGELRFDDRIYEASPHSLRKVVSEIENGFSSAMIVGHNPGIEGFIKYLTGEFEPMPTAALAVIKLNVENWEDVAGNTGSLKTVLRPKDVKKSFGTGS